jgi:DNA polymerase III gamma/tau subunit
MSLYQKYRPRTLERVKGNEQAIKSLDSLLNKGKDCPHAFLLTGETGCGKTTVGRIILKRLGCLGTDLIEVDSGQFRGIDTVREIRSQSHYKAREGTNRGWLLDEVHQTTKEAQNALLKLLEDTPPHVYLVLCTTEPQKLLSTIKGRCSTFKMLPLTERTMLTLLKSIVTREEEELEDEIYEQIIEHANGHPRNAIQVLEQVLSVPKESRLEVSKKTDEEVQDAIELCRALGRGAQWKEVRIILQGLKDQEAEGIRRLVLVYCQSVLLSKDDALYGLILEEFINPFYDSGFPQLVYACYSVTKNK